MLLAFDYRVPTSPGQQPRRGSPLSPCSAPEGGNERATPLSRDGMERARRGTAVICGDRSIDLLQSGFFGEEVKVQLKGWGGIAAPRDSTGKTRKREKPLPRLKK